MVGCVVVEDGAGDAVAVVTGLDVVPTVVAVDVDVVMAIEGVESPVDTIASSLLRPSVSESAIDTAARRPAAARRPDEERRTDHEVLSPNRARPTIR